MLYLMRKHAASWMIKAVLILVALSFVVWGGYRMRENRMIRIASVNGEPVTIDEYKESYNNLLGQLRQSLGDNLNDEMMKMLRVDKQAFDQLVDQKLLLQQAQRLNFSISDQELSNTIRNMPVFQNAGNFDSRRYQLVLNNARLSPEGFEAIQKDAMLIQKIRTFITDTVKISYLEAWEWYKWQNASINIDVVLFEPDNFKNMTTSAEEIKKYFDEHKDTYKTDPKIKVGYLHFDPKTYSAKVKVPQEEIVLYYEDNPDEFKTPKTVEARHILIKVASDAPDDEVETARKKTLDVLKQAKEGADFAELAKQYSEGPTKDTGGYLGAFPKEAMVKPFSDKAFSMKAGEISEPVRTQFGWHVIKVEKVNEASTLPKGKAEEKIRKKLIEERSKLSAWDNAESIYETIFDGDDLKKLAKDQGLVFRSTDFFTQKELPKDIKNPQAFATAAFDLSVMQISEIQDFEDGFYILQVIEKIPPEIPELTLVEEKVQADLIKEKQREKAKEEATLYLEALKSGKSMSEAGEQFDVTTTTTDFFKRNESIPNIGYESAVSRAAFKLSEKNNLPENPISGQKGFFVIQFTERKEPELTAFDEEKTKTKESLLQLKKRKAFDAWLSQVKKESEISVEEGFFKE